MLIQVVLFEAAQRYWWASEGFERFRAQEKFKLIEHLSRALEKSELSVMPKASLFEDGQLMAWRVCKPQMMACEALAWLAYHGGLEGQFELSTILMNDDPRVQSVSQHVLRMWHGVEPAPEER